MKYQNIPRNRKDNPLKFEDQKEKVVSEKNKKVVKMSGVTGMKWREYHSSKDIDRKIMPRRNKDLAFKKKEKSHSEKWGEQMMKDREERINAIANRYQGVKRPKS